jgi:hypothetical protein
MNHQDIYSESLLYQWKSAIFMNTCYSQICILQHNYDIQNKMHFLWISYYRGIISYCGRPKQQVKQVSKLELNIPMNN